MSERPDGTAAEQSTDNTAFEHSPSMDTQAAVDQAMNELEGISDIDRLRGELDAAKAEHATMHDKYVRLHAEFDNFRKRTAKERLDLLQTASGDALKSVLPVLDDFERAIANNGNVEDPAALKQGFELIQQKLSNILLAQGMKPMRAKGEPFDPEFHEAIVQSPAPTPDLKGKVIEVIENGYTLNDKVVRYAKVVVGQ
ncbi:MAG TPA: nucleotide exchange factor GrpE [Flavobacteriales bacterium]